MGPRAGPGPGLVHLRAAVGRGQEVLWGFEVGTLAFLVAVVGLLAALPHWLRGFALLVAFAAARHLWGCVSKVGREGGSGGLF